MRVAVNRSSKRRRAAGHRLDHGQPERLGPVDQEHEGQGFAEKIGLLLLVDFADELYARSFEQRSNLLAEIGLVHPIHFGRYLEWDAKSLRNLDRAIDALHR